jgi:hypothetical protein
MNTTFICGVNPINLGLGVNGIAYENPNNSLDFAMANAKYGVETGRFMKTTPTGKKLPDPAKTLSNFFKKGPRGGSGLPVVAPPSINSYTVGQGVNRYTNAILRNQSRSFLRRRGRGLLAVSQTPNVLRRELALDRSQAVTQRVGYDGQPFVNRIVNEADNVGEEGNNAVVDDINRLAEQMQNLLVDDDEGIADRVMRRRRPPPEPEPEPEEKQEVLDDERKEGEVAEGAEEEKRGEEDIENPEEMK